MSTTTSNYDLIKPELTDVADITAFNENWDVIDNTMKTLEADVSTAQTAADGKAPTNHSSTATTYGVGTSSNYGHLKLSDSTSSTSGTSGGVAATPSAVKSAYDRASTAINDAASAQSTANTANTTAKAAMPKSGGTFTGAVGYKTANADVVKNTSYSFRNIAVFNSSNTAVSSGNIRMIRK